MTEDIWKQPAGGFNDETSGRTEEQIFQKESELGFKFPALYREHMKIQNGGYLWKSAFIHNAEVNELLYNGSTIDPIKNHKGYKTLKDVLFEYTDKEKPENSSTFQFFDLNRLPILSHMDGHTMLCFDYGYNVEFPYESPEIIHVELVGVENGFKEKLRIKSYDDLIANLVYYGYESTSFYIGLKSGESIEKIADIFCKAFDVRMELKENNGYGWYNFEKWYFSELKINAGLSALVRITPNQFLSSTYLFQNNKEFNYIVDIELRIGTESLQNNSDYLRCIIEEKFISFLSGMNWKFLLIPFNKANPGELDKLRKAAESEENPAENKLPPAMHKSNGGDAGQESSNPIKQKPWWKGLWP